MSRPCVCFRSFMVGWQLLESALDPSRFRGDTADVRQPGPKCSSTDVEPAAPETQPLQVCSWPHAKSKTWNQAQCMPVTNTSSAHAWNECMSASTRPRHSARAPLHTAFVCDVHAERAPRKRAGVSGDHTGDHYSTHRSETERESPLRASCERRASRGSSVSVLSLSRRAHASNRRRYIFSSPKVPHERSTRVVHCVESRDAYVRVTSYKTQTATRESILQSAAQGSSSAARNLVLGVGRVPASPGARSSERLRANRMPRLTSSVSGMRALM